MNLLNTIFIFVNILFTFLFLNERLNNELILSKTGYIKNYYCSHYDKNLIRSAKLNGLAFSERINVKDLDYPCGDEIHPIIIQYKEGRFGVKYLISLDNPLNNKKITKTWNFHYHGRGSHNN